MAITPINIYGLVGILMGDPSETGGMGTTLVEVFGQTVTGTANITTTDPTITDIPIEESDDPLMSITTPGVMNLNFSTYNLGPTALVKAFGGTVSGTGVTEIWEAPANAPEIIQSVRINTKNGRFLEMPKVKINPRMGIVFDKTTPGKIDFACTILIPDDPTASKLTIGRTI